jgi:hypothetical protein
MSPDKDKMLLFVTDVVYQYVSYMIIFRYFFGDVYKVLLQLTMNKPTNLKTFQDGTLILL